MYKVSESIWSNKDVVIPMADVQHIEKDYSCYSSDDDTIKKGGFSGLTIITKHTRMDVHTGVWVNPITVSNHDKSAERFIKDWCFYRYELEGGEKRFKSPKE